MHTIHVGHLSDTDIALNYSSIVRPRPSKMTEVLRNFNHKRLETLRRKQVQKLINLFLRNCYVKHFNINWII
jgi:hypothetical protein